MAKIRVCIFVEYKTQMNNLKYRIKEEVMTDGTSRFLAEISDDFLGANVWRRISSDYHRTLDEAKEVIEKNKSMIRVASTIYHDVE